MATEDGGTGVKDSAISIGAFVAALLAFVVKWGIVILIAGVIIYIIYRICKSDGSVDVSKMTMEELQAYIAAQKKEEGKE